MVTIYVFGENVLDLESRIEEAKLKGAVLTPDYLGVQFGTALRAIDETNRVTYYGLIDLDDRRIAPRNSSGHKIPVDKKYFVKGAFVPMTDDEAGMWGRTSKIDNFVDLTVLTKTGGGGAHNSSTGMQVYLNEIIENEKRRVSTPSGDIEAVRLYVPYGSNFIRQRLPKNLIYTPLIRDDESKIGININVALNWGKKFTFRSAPTILEEDLRDKKLEFDIKPGDILVINSLKDSSYLELVEKKITPEIKFYYAPTDSMIKALGRERVYNLAMKADVVISNEYEFRLMVGKEYSEMKDKKDGPLDTREFPSSAELVNALREFQEDHCKDGGKKVLVIVTHDARGATASDSIEHIFYQTAAVRERVDPYQSFSDTIINTNGCGDAFFSIAVVGALLGHPTQKILQDANAAGHLCAFNPEASGPWSATREGIKKFREVFGNPAVHYWSHDSKQFAPM